ncbi:sin3 associated polypeptide p18-like protein [Plasmodium relictum]|uniref:Sin3 associated polypeptide p18-like protein n=1 Tax=Plasmodium relictum TaxID=85471 RepID=A0A1J1H196_PLARL|nr:sin3 associated polypeptide p18-like protein [Plasmodium relictum]CRG98444.1 sin3 associated polypeptide p18-like protein [Plasmodium relictum]
MSSCVSKSKSMSLSISYSSKNGTDKNIENKKNSSNNYSIEENINEDRKCEQNTKNDVNISEKLKEHMKLAENKISENKKLKNFGLKHRITEENNNNDLNKKKRKKEHIYSSDRVSISFNDDEKKERKKKKKRNTRRKKSENNPKYLKRDSYDISTKRKKKKEYGKYKKYSSNTSTYDIYEEKRKDKKRMRNEEYKRKRCNRLKSISISSFYEDINYSDSKSENSDYNKKKKIYDNIKKINKYEEEKKRKKKKNNKERNNIGKLDKSKNYNRNKSKDSYSTNLSYEEFKKKKKSKNEHKDQILSSGEKDKKTNNSKYANTENLGNFNISKNHMNKTDIKDGESEDSDGYLSKSKKHEKKILKKKLKHEEKSEKEKLSEWELEKGRTKEKNNKERDKKKKKKKRKYNGYDSETTENFLSTNEVSDSNYSALSKEKQSLFSNSAPDELSKSKSKDSYIKRRSSESEKRNQDEKITKKKKKRKRRVKSYSDGNSDDFNYSFKKDVQKERENKKYGKVNENNKRNDSMIKFENKRQSFYYDATPRYRHYEYHNLKNTIYGNKYYNNKNINDTEKTGIINREKSCPFLLRLFYKHDSEYNDDDINLYSKDFNSNELQIYAWIDITMREIVTLVKDFYEESRKRNAEWIFKVLSNEKKQLTFLSKIHSTKYNYKEDNKTLLSLNYEIGDIILLSILFDK